VIYREQQQRPKPLYHAVGCFCVHNTGILLLRRSRDKSHPGKWCIPGGKVRAGESVLEAMVRELYEETGCLLSSDNLRLLRTYHVIQRDVSYMYTVFRSDFRTEPRVRLRPLEHTVSVWLSPSAALAEDLIPDLDACIEDEFVMNRKPVTQFSLFGDARHGRSLRTAKLEKARSERDAPLALLTTADTRTWYASFGPVSAGKSTGLKAMRARNKSLCYVRDNTMLNVRSRLNFYLQKAFRDGVLSFFFRFQMDALPLRFRQTLDAPNNSLVDETILSTLAYSRALLMLDWITEHEYATFFANYQFLRKIMPRPQTVFYFNCRVDTIMQRIAERARRTPNRMIEKEYDIKYIQAQVEAFAELADELSPGLRVVPIDTDTLRPRQLARIYAP